MFAKKALFLKIRQNLGFRQIQFISKFDKNKIYSFLDEVKNVHLNHSFI